MIDRDFGNWLAGFIDGEGCFYIAHDRQRAVLRARFSIALRGDDRPILEQCRDQLGIGTIHDYRATSSGARTTRWMVQSHRDCDALCAVLERHPLRAKKRNDFAVWRRAVEAQRRIRPGRADNSSVQNELENLKSELACVRRQGLSASA